MSFITTSSLVFLAAFPEQNLLTLKLNKIEYMTCSLIQGKVVKNQLFHQFGRRLIGQFRIVQQQKNRVEVQGNN